MSSTTHPWVSAATVAPRPVGLLVAVAPWLAPDFDPLRAAIVGHALAAVGVCEEPLGSNRGPQVDRYNGAFGSPLGSFWCANFAGSCYVAAGASVPPTEVGSVRRWVPWARNFKTWREPTGYQPVPGDLVLYGKLAEGANHCGIIVRNDTVTMLSVEGNTTMNTHDRNGTFVAVKQPALDRVVGYITPRAKAL